LSLGGIDKYIGRDDDRRLAVILEPYGVVQTARYAGPSISEAFDNEVALLQYLLAQLVGGRPGRRELAVMLDFDVWQKLIQALLNVLQHDVPARLVDVEQSDSAHYAFGARCQGASDWYAFVGRVKNSH
jgi:hypothetical protein